LLNQAGGEARHDVDRLVDDRAEYPRSRASEVPAELARLADGDDCRRIILGREFQHLAPVMCESFEQVEPVHVGGLVEHEETKLTRRHNVSRSALGANFLVARDRYPSAPANFGDPLLVWTVSGEVAVEISKTRRTD
jgi:hypothetical protein